MSRSVRTCSALGHLFESTLGRLLKALAEAFCELECRLSRWWVAGAHHRLMLVELGPPPPPKNLDHHIDLYFQWLRNRDAVWPQRGVFNGLALSGGKMLELTCGDGFNARNFYSLKSAHVTAYDIDESIIRTARRKNSAANVTFTTANIINAFPAGRNGNVIWDFGFPITEFFSAEQLNLIFTNVKSALEPGGMFSGYTMSEDASNNFTEARGADGEQGAIVRSPGILLRKCDGVRGPVAGMAQSVFLGFGWGTAVSAGLADALHVAILRV